MKSPKLIDPMQTAAAQSASNRDTAITQQLLNMTNQVTPWGNQTFNQSGNATYTGADGKPVNTPTFTSTQTLSPNQSTINQQNETADINQNKIALGQIDRMGEHLSTPFKYGVGEHEKWAGEQYGKLNDETNQRNVGLMEQKLANQGLQPGSVAYDDAMRNLTYGQEKGRNDFMLGSFGQGMNTALTNRNQPFNEVGALMSGSQVQQPTFVNTPTTGVNGTDVAGLINANSQQQQQAYQAKMGGLFGLGSAALGGWALSDKRAKNDIKKVGKLHDGTGIYAYTYKGKHGGGLMQLGVLAQEAKKNHPYAVAKADDGLYRVNYSRIAEELVA
jgi:hypothetical protein